MAADDPKKVEDLFQDLAQVCNRVRPILNGNRELIQAIGASVEALAPRLDQAIEQLRGAIQAQTRLLEQAAASLGQDEGDAVAALDAVPAKVRDAGASLDGLASALQQGAQRVAEARSGYAQVVSAGVDALELALEGYGRAAESAATELAAAHQAATDELQGLAGTLDQARATRVEQEEEWAEAIDALVEAAAEAPKALALTLAEGADEAASSLVASVNTSIDTYHEVVAPWGPVYPRFMVEDGDAFSTARDALTEALAGLGELVDGRQEEVVGAELAMLDQLMVVSPALDARQDDLRPVEGVNQ